MNKFFKSRFFIVTLIIAMLLCIMPATLALMGQGSFVRSVAVTVVSPFQHAASYIGESLGGFARYFTHYDELKEENERLKQQLAEQRQENYEANLYKAENEWLKDYLELKRVNSSLELVDARVIGRETTNTRIIYTLDRGSSAGITKNMPIITAEGVVGHIVEGEIIGSLFDAFGSVCRFFEYSRYCIQNQSIVGIGFFHSSATRHSSSYHSCPKRRISGSLRN